MNTEPNFLNKEAPPNYIAGLGRGATGFAVATRADIGPSIAQNDSNDRFKDADEDTGLFLTGKFDKEDDEADLIYNLVDQKLSRKQKDQNKDQNLSIHSQFKDLKRGLQVMSNDDWANIPEVVDMVRKRGSKKIREDVYERNSNVPDSVIISSVAAGSNNFDSVEQTDFEQFNKAKNDMIKIKLDQLTRPEDASVFDVSTYQEELNNMALKTDTEISDMKKARKLLKSVTSVNPQQASGWIAAARLEETAGNLQDARDIIRTGCDNCPRSEDVWLEMARLNEKNAKQILAEAVMRIPSSAQIWLKAAGYETDLKARKKVLRKALENNPTSVQLWKETISAEDDKEDAKILLSKAVECVPNSPELWLAFARLEQGVNAQKILNRARAENPTSHEIWIAAAKLMEKENDDAKVSKVVQAAIRELSRLGVMVGRDDWLLEAEKCEKDRHLVVMNEIVKHTIGLELEETEWKRNWLDLAEEESKKGYPEMSRSVFEHAAEKLGNKKSVWIQYAFFEKESGKYDRILNVLKRAVAKCPHSELLWLMYAKEMWSSGDVGTAKNIIKASFEHHAGSEQVWLAASKLAMETGEYTEAEEILEKARKSAGTARVWTKSTTLARIMKKCKFALELVSKGLETHPKYHKLWLIKGQILANDLKLEKDAKAFYELATKKLPHEPKVWIESSRFEESLGHMTKSRALLEQASIHNPKNAEILAESVDLEFRANNTAIAKALLFKALQKCPLSGVLWSKMILNEFRPQRKARAADATKKCENDSTVIMTIARLFWDERKYDKARSWFSKSTEIERDNGDCWAWWLKFEQERGTTDQQNAVIQKCIAAEPKHGVEWPKQTKAIHNFGKSVEQNLLELCSKLSNKI